MRASEFIKELQKAVDKYGDLHVVMESPSSGDFIIPCNITPFTFNNYGDEDYEVDCRVCDMENDFETVKVDRFKEDYFYLN